ncbi:MAG TPA: Calx-beta domain-containing protein [Thermoanaerobaculia bacterium]
MLQRRTLSLVLVLLGFLLLPSVSGAADVTVELGASAFIPSSVTINVGDTVTWINDTGIEHTVTANNGSFNSGPPDDSFTFSHTFDTAGTFGYHCQPHQLLGMVGQVIVEDTGGGGDDPGTIRFSQANYSVNEGAGTATITVSRTGGDDGAVSATWSATAGTAVIPSDFAGGSGILSWADGDDSNKTFTVQIANDSANEPNETVALRLTNPTGGATLDTQLRNATLTILDNDSAPGGAPAAPTNLVAVPHSTTEIMLTWTDASNNETGFRIERRTFNGTFEEIDTVPANTTGLHVSGLDPGTFYLFRVRAQNGSAASPFSNLAFAATNAAVAPCVASDTVLCVNNNRFKVQVLWQTPAVGSGSGHAVPVPSAPDSGLFYFFDAANIEMLIKVLNACSGTRPRYWVFYAATTNVELAVTVTDTQTGQVKAYYNPQGTPAPPVQDTNAFATCP